MKKRLLALALCLVMAVSLLPITAAANDDNYIRITGSGFEKNAGSGYVLKDNQLEIYWHGSNLSSLPLLLLYFESLGLYQDSEGNIPITDALVDGSTYYLKYNIGGPRDMADDDEFIQFANSLNASNCSLVIPGYTVSFVSSNGDFGDDRIKMDFVFQVTKNHNWRFTVSKNNDTLTAQCQNEGCTTPPLSVTLKADSVTLPTSPFNAQLAGEKEFQAAFPNAAISQIRYDYKGSDGVWQRDIDPIAANAKAGEYQAFVEITNLPGTVVDESGNPLNQAYLYVKYTAADPKVTAQTGDNRPIEIMMGSVLVFSALAAAAFVVDSKRKYSR